MNIRKMYFNTGWRHSDYKDEI